MGGGGAGYRVDILTLVGGQILIDGGESPVRISRGCTAPASKGHGYVVVGLWRVDVAPERRAAALANAGAWWGGSVQWVSVGVLAGHDTSTGVTMRIDGLRHELPVTVDVRSPCSPVETAQGRA
jgi:hypothetical protein